MVESAEQQVVARGTLLLRFAPPVRSVEPGLALATLFARPDGRASADTLLALRVEVVPCGSACGGLGEGYRVALGAERAPVSLADQLLDRVSLAAVARRATVFIEVPVRDTVHARPTVDFVADRLRRDGVPGTCIRTFAAARLEGRTLAEGAALRLHLVSECEDGR